MMAVLCRVDATARRFADSIARALTERRTGFSDREAGDFLDHADRLAMAEELVEELSPWATDGGPTEWLAPHTSAPPAGEQPTGAGVTGPGAGAAAPPEWATSVLLTAAAHLIATLTGPQPIVRPVEGDTRRRLRREYASELIPELRDRAAQFEAIED